MSRWIVAVILVTGTVWAYRPILSNPFVYEDANIATPSAGWIPRRPLAPLSAKVLKTPVQAHAFSLAVHLLNGGLVWFLAMCLGMSPWASLIALGIFLLHPIQSEAVAYAVERSDLMSLTGILFAVLATTWRDRTWIGVVVGSLLAMAAKESGIVVLALVPWTWWMQERDWPRWATVLTVYVSVGLVMLFGMIVSTSGFWWASRLGLAGWRLLSLVLIPIGLSVDHDYTGLAVWQGVLAGVALVAGGVHVFMSTRHLETRFAVGWIACCLLPRIFVRVPLSILPEHQVYAAMVGVSLWGGSFACRYLSGPVTTSRAAI